MALLDESYADSVIVELPPGTETMEGFNNIQFRPPLIAHEIAHTYDVYCIPISYPQAFVSAKENLHLNFRIVIISRTS
jgi:hypothetical protein